MNIFFLSRNQMGGGGSETNSSLIVENETVNRSTTSVLNKTMNSEQAEMIATQNIIIENVDYLCSVNISQSYDGEMTLIQELKVEEEAQLKTDILADLEQQMLAENESSSGFMDMFNGGSESNSYQESKNKIMNEMTTELSTISVNEIRASMKVGQSLVIRDVTIDPMGIGVYTRIAEKLGFPAQIVSDTLVKLTEDSQNVTCNVNQDMAMKIIAEQITDKITEVVNTNAALQEIAQEIDASTKSKSKGVGDVVGDVGDAVAGVVDSAGDAASDVIDAGGDAAAGAILAAYAPMLGASASCALVMVAGMMMMRKKGGGMDPVLMAMLARK
jgi:hypothetical protein